jgi:4-hydroxybenzoyl-CoA reductase subunit beta
MLRPYIAGRGLAATVKVLNMLRLPSFTYRQPGTLAEALRMKADAGPDGMYVGGGTDLYPNMKRRHQEPKVVVSLMGIRELAGWGMRDAGCVVGPCMTLTDLCAHPTIRQHYDTVAHAAELVSTPLLRNMGTLGGNLCLDTRCNYYNQTYEWRKAIDFCMKKDGKICWVAPSSPRCWAVSSSDVAPVMVALGAEYRLVGPQGERIVPAARFYHNDGINYLTKQPDEILAEIRLPAPDGWDAVYHKLRRRGSFDFPVLGVAAWVKWEPGRGKGKGGRVVDARVVLGGVASQPQEVPEAGAAIRDSDLGDDAIAAAAEAAYRPAKPLDNTDFDLSWRKQMTRVYVQAALQELRQHRAAHAAP